jgi:signal transduction histidine kinase
MSLGVSVPAPAGSVSSILGKRLSREGFLSIFRLLIALILLALFPLARTMAGLHGSALLLVLSGYALSSLILLLRPPLASGTRLLPMIFVHLSDVAWPCVLCLFTGGVSSPFLLLLLFSLMAVTYQRTAPQALIFPSLGILVVVGESVLGVLPSKPSLSSLGDLSHLAVFAPIAAILVVLWAFEMKTGIWTDREQKTYAVQSVLQCLRSDADIQVNFREILPQLVEIFGAKRVVLVLRNSSESRVFEWGAGASHQGPLYRNLPQSQEARYFWPMSLPCWSLACTRIGGKMDYFALDRTGDRISADLEAFSAAFSWDEPFRCLLTSTLQFGSQWSGYIFVVDPACVGGRESSLRLLHRLAGEVGRVVHHFHVWQHTSARIRSIERRRLARDLHDGVIQSLIAAEIQLDVLRRRSQAVQPAESISETMLAAQNVLREEARKLREEMERLRASELPHQARSRVTDLLEVFRRESGIVTRFICNVDEDAIPEKISEDLIRVVQEALSNVRRHSGASTVEVRLTARQDMWEVVIQDDGRGFDFSGCLSLAQLEAVRKGPRSIRERVQSANGDLVVESHPDRGASLKVRLASSF